MIKQRPYILTIGGFDPSGGAGILADIKSMEQNGCIGMAVQTANTIQSGDQFLAVNWVDEALIEQQLRLLISSYSFRLLKIGLIPSLTLLNRLVDICRGAQPKLKVIWDPVLSASAGYDFNQNLMNLEDTLRKVSLITPNFNEIKQLSLMDDPIEGARKLSKYCNVLLKGGHHPERQGYDHLFFEGQLLTFKPKAIKYNEKHGTGCVLSSAIAANLAKGYPIRKSILRSKRYIERFIESQPHLIGAHR